MKKMYIKKIVAAMERCDDIALLDLILKMLEKTEQQKEAIAEPSK